MAVDSGQKQLSPRHSQLNSPPHPRTRWRGRSLGDLTPAWLQDICHPAQAWLSLEKPTLRASVIFRITYIQFLSPGPTKNHTITTTTFACMAAVLYATEVAWVCVSPGDVSNCVPTLPGMLRRLENYVACVIFIFISSPYLYQHQLALVWYVAMYSICFILGAMNFMVKGSDCDEDTKLPVRFPRFLSGQTVLSIFFYILWPLYKFSKKFGVQPQRSSNGSCRDRLTSLVCIWDQRLAVTVMTAINLLIYAADMAYLAQEAFVGTKDQPRGSRFLF
ncbi:myeloid-associated differentiation marker-like [Orcinus orca]|uniref:myeloid-associated differentiation marker-like n=1 Tax=Orcinus orca TaxID=9733 RepID=UPI002111D39B|nr:myeloid-associated differentiation marker-like [Orcinus orca]